MRVVVVVSSKKRPVFLRLFLLQMANQTVRPEIVVVHENGQPRSMKEILDDIPIRTDFLLSTGTLSTPGYAIQGLRRALEYSPDVVIQMCDDNLYSATHIENMLGGLQGGHDVSYLLHCDILRDSPAENIAYYKEVNWGKFSQNKFGLEDGFALTQRAAHQYLSYLEFAISEHKKKGCCLSLHPSDGVRYAYLHPEDAKYSFLRNVNFIPTGTTVTWVYRGDNDSGIITAEQMSKQLEGCV